MKTNSLLSSTSQITDNSSTQTEVVAETNITEFSPSGLVLRGSGNSKPTSRKPLRPADVIGLQRTVGNQAVMRMLEKRRGEKATNVTETVQPVTVQRKIADKAFLLGDGTLKGRMLNSNWTQLKEAYVKYGKAPAGLELAYLSDMKPMVEQWISSHSSSKSKSDKNRLLVLKNFQVKLEQEISRLLSVLADKTGLALSLLKEMQTATRADTLKYLVQAEHYLEQGQLGMADKALTQLKETIPETFPLIKGALVRNHIGTINPKLAELMENQKYEQKNATSAAKGEQLFNKNGVYNHQAAYKEYKDSVQNPQPINPASKNADSEQAEQTKRLKEFSNKNLVDLQAINNMAEWEKNAIRAYTGGSYHNINTSLRSGLELGKAKLTDNPKKGVFVLNEDKQAFTENTVSALNKLPPYNGEVYRHDKLFPGFEEFYREGAIISDMAFTSATYLATSLGKPSLGADILSIIKSKTARFIKPLSEHVQEDEVLFKPGTRFKVTKVIKAANDPSAQNDVFTKWPANLDPNLKSVLAANPYGDLVKFIVVREEV